MLLLTLFLAFVFFLTRFIIDVPNLLSDPHRKPLLYQHPKLVELLYFVSIVGLILNLPINRPKDNPVQRLNSQRRPHNNDIFQSQDECRAHRPDDVAEVVVARRGFA
jgi:hypothetical protein